jgi:hypothetical protein
MQIDLAELRHLLPTGGGRLSFELRDDQGRLIANAELEVASQRAGPTIHVSEPGRDAISAAEDAPGPNFLSIIS